MVEVGAVEFRGGCAVDVEAVGHVGKAREVDAGIFVLAKYF